MAKTINIRVIPNASRNEVSDEGGSLKVRVATPPSRGKANKAVIKLLAEVLGVKSSENRIVSGDKTRDKVIEVQG